MFGDDAVALEDEGAGHDVVEEGAVVGDDDERPGVVDQDVFQDIEGFGVQVVGRFVEHQHVGGLGEETGEEEAIPFAAREDLGLGAGAGRVEEEVLQVTDDVARAALDFHAIGIPGDVLGDGLGVVDLLAHLVEVHDLELRAELQVAAGGRELSEKHLHQGRLAGPIRADESDLIPAGQRHAEIPDDGMAAGVGEGDVLGLDYAHAGAFGFADFHLGGTGGRTHVAALGAHDLQGFHAGVGFGAPGAGAPAGPSFFLAEFLVEGGPLTFFRDEELFLADEVGVVVAGPAGELAAVEFDDAVGHATQEGAVVRDEQQGDLFFEQEFLHPEDRVEVEVVGRLVEQQQAGLGGEGLGQQAAALKASREVVEGPVLRQAEAGDQVVDADVLFPIFGDVVCAQAGGHDIADVAGEVFGDFLGQARDADAVGLGDGARVGRVFAGRDAHERGLAGPVTAEQADAFTFLDLEVEVVENGWAAETDVDVEQTE